MKDVEGIQRRAARFVKGCYVPVCKELSQTYSMNWNGHRYSKGDKLSRLTMMFEIVNDQSCPVRIPDYVKKKTRITRSVYPKRFINLGSKSNTYIYSFFLRTVKEWNGLPDELIEQETLESFKSALADYLNLNH